MRYSYILLAALLWLMPSAASARLYYFCYAIGYNMNRPTHVMGGVAILRDGYRPGETQRMREEFERRMLTQYSRMNSLTCYNPEASVDSTRKRMRESLESYRSRGVPVAEIDFNIDYTAGEPDGRAPRAPGVYVTLPQTTPPKPVSDQELRFRQRDAEEQSRAKASYEQQRARQEAEYARVARENARRQAAYKAQIAKQQADYKAMLAAREAQAAKARAEWEARVARCKAGDKKSCGGQATER